MKLGVVLPSAGPNTGADNIVATAKLEEGLGRLRRYCEAEGRDPDSLSIIVRPGDTYEVDKTVHACQVELGVDHLVIDTPIKEPGPGLARLRAMMERVAHICGE